MKKIIFLLINPKLGGAEKVIINIANKLNKKKFDVTLFLFFKKGELLNTIDSSVKVDYAYDKEYQSMLWSLPKILRKLYKYKNYDLIIAGSEVWPTYVAGIFSFLCNIKAFSWVHTNLKIIMRKHGFFKRCLFTLLNWISYHTINKIIVVSSACEVPQYASGKVEIIPNSYNKRDLLFLARESICDFDFENSDEPVILSVSRLDPIKNISLLIEAHARLLGEGVKEKVLIIGDGSDLTHLIELTVALGMSDSVTFLGKKSNPYPYFAKATVFVNPSLLEGFSLTGVESMALGTPVISTDLPNACALLIRNNQDGLIVPNNSIESLARAIHYLISNPQLRTNISAAAKLSVEKYEESNILKKVSICLDNG